MKLCPITTNYSYSIYRQPNFNGDKKSNDNDNKNGNYKMTIAPGQKNIDYKKGFTRNARHAINNELYINEYDVETGNLKRNTFYKNGSSNIDHIEDYNPKTGNVIKYIDYNMSGGLYSIEEYNTENGQRSKLTLYYKDGETIKQIFNYSPTTGKIETSKTYRENGTLYFSMVDYPDEKMFVRTYYDIDGKTITYIECVDKITHTSRFVKPGGELL